MIKEQARPMPIPAGNTTASAEEQEMNEAGMELASAEEIELAKGVVENVVRYIYSDGAPDIIEQISDGNPQSLGEVAGNLVTNEIALEEEEGRDISRDIEVEIITEIVHELTDLAMMENIVDLPDERSEQTFLGEALTYAIGAAVESNDPQFAPDSMMEMITNMLNEGSQSGQPVDGVMAPQEAINGS